MGPLRRCIEAMDSIQHKILTDALQLHFLAEIGDLTHANIRDMLVLVRRLKTRLEVLDAQKENDI